MKEILNKLDYMIWKNQNEARDLKGLPRISWRDYQEELKLKAKYEI